TTIISTVNSLTLSPALSALLLKPRQKGTYQALPWPAFVVLGGWAGYVWLGPSFLDHAGSAARLASPAFASYLLDLGPALGIPSQAMGYLLVNIQLPDSAAVERTQRVLDEIDDIARNKGEIFHLKPEEKVHGVRSTVAIAGQSMLLNAFGSNFGTMFLTLDEF